MARAIRFAVLALPLAALPLTADTIKWQNTSNTNWAPNNCSTAWKDTTTPSNACTGGQTNQASEINFLENNDVIVDNSVQARAKPATFMNFSSGTGLTLNTLTIGSGFTVTVEAGNTLTLSSGGTLDGISGTHSAAILTTSGVIVNQGLLTNNGTITGTGSFTNTGTITGGTISVTGLFQNAGGTVENLTIGGNTVINGGTVAGAIVNNGTLNGVTNTTTINSGRISGNTNNSLGIMNNVTFTNASLSGGSIGGTLTASGTASTFSGVTNNGTLTAASGQINWMGGTNTGTLSAGTGTLAVSGTVNGSGTFNNAMFSGANLTSVTITGNNNTFTGNNTLSGTVINNGALAVNSGTTTVSGTLHTDSGTVTVAGGTLDIAGAVDPAEDFTLESGSVVLSGTLDVNTANLLGGSIDGTGAFMGVTVNNGDGSNNTDSEGVQLDVGGSAAAGGNGAGDYTFGSYNQDSGGALGITFNAGATGNDLLTTTGEASINGTLVLYDANGDILNTSELNTSTVYELIDDTGGVVNGEFSALDVNGLAGSAIGAPPNATGWFLVYNGSLSSGGGGDVQLQYAVATPEPATDILLGCAIIGLALLQKKRARR